MESISMDEAATIATIDVNQSNGVEDDKKSDLPEDLKEAVDSREHVASVVDGKSLNVTANGGSHDLHERPETSTVDKVEMESKESEPDATIADTPLKGKKPNGAETDNEADGHTGTEGAAKLVDQSNHDANRSDVNKEEKPIEMTLEQRAKDAAKEVAKYGDYLQLMEERVASLELKLKLGKSLDDASESDSKKGKKDKSTKREPAIPELRRVRWAEFKNKIKDDKKVYAMEALVGEVKYWYQRATQRKPDKIEEDGFSTFNTQVTQGVYQKEIVKRVRINSVPIMTILSDVTDCEWSPEPTVLLYPFKLLVERGPAIRDHMERLEYKWNSMAREGSSSRSTSPEARARNDIEQNITEPTNRPVNEMEADKGTASPRPTDQEEQRESKEDLMDSLETYKDMRCLVRFMDEEVEPVLAKMRDKCRTRIAFQDLWHLFRPGDEVYVPRLSIDDPVASQDPTASQSSQAAHKRNDRYQEHWRILSCGGGRANLSAGENEDSVVQKHRTNPFVAHAYYVDFNGKQFGVSTHLFKIKPFEGERDITALEFYPARFLRNWEERRARLKSRGERFVEMRSFQHRQYKGTTFACQPCGCAFDSDQTVNPEPIDSQIVIDFAEAIQNDYQWHPPGRIVDASCAYTRELDDDVPLFMWKNNEQDDDPEKIFDIIYNDEAEDRERTHAFESSHPLLREDPDPAYTQGWGLGEDELILLPARVLAFVFRNRKFAALHIDHLSSVKAYTRGWDDLKLPPGHKDMLRALVKTHLSDKKPRLEGEDREHTHDLVRGKGQGLVVLLHGVPGVGKTSTAECVAESNGKPLFPITCGDLGVTAESVEEALEEKFHLAQIWDCVLLLDEADVFLAERTREDIKRNALVSVFLRVLEYYTGILFLTTNRVGAFDDAFKSRIHLPLYFPPLREKQTIAIWKMNLKRTLERKEGMMEADVDEIVSFAKDQFSKGQKTDSNWNGRQIRNAFQTAAALAEFDAQSRNQNQKGPVYSRLHTKHFNVVAQASQQFDDYIKSFSDTGADRAVQNSYRNDAFQHAGIKLGGDEKIGVPKSTPLSKGQRARENQTDYDNQDDYDDPEISAPPPRSRPSPRTRETAPDDYSIRGASRSHMPIAQRRAQQPPRSSQLQTSSPRPRRSDYGYPTPDTSGSLVHEQMERQGSFYPPPASRGGGSDTKRRGLGMQRGAVAGARQMESEGESEEPDYSEDDDEDGV